MLFPSIENAQNKGQNKKKGPVGVQAWAAQLQPQPRNDPAVVHVGSVIPLRPTARMSTGGRPRPAQPQQPQNDPAVVYVGHVPFPIRPPILNTPNSFGQTIPIRPIPNTTQTSQQSRRARVIQPRNGRPIMAISTAVQPQQNGPSVIQTRSQQNGPSGPHTRAQPQRGGPSAGSNGPTTNATRPSDAFA